MHILQKWLLSEQNFKEGLHLLKAHSGSPTWINIFEKLGESTFTRVELYKQIDAVLRKIEEKVIAPEPIVIKKVTKPSEAETAPTKIKEIIEDRKLNFKLAVQLHHSLVLHVESMILKKTGIVDSKSTVFELRNLLQKIDEAFAITDKFDSNPEKIPEPPKKISTIKHIDINRASDRRRVLKTYLSESYLKRKKPEDREVFILRTKQELEEIENLIIENESIIQLQ